MSRAAAGPTPRDPSAPSAGSAATGPATDGPVPPGVLDVYRRGADALVEGRPADALADLERAAEAGVRAARLALAKALLELRRGGEAARALAPLLAGPPEGPGAHAYLLLLAAAADALDARPADAVARLAEVGRLDPRLEHAARDLRRRIERDRPPVVRL